MADFFLMFFLGIVLGSFSTALIHRVPNDVAWWGKSRSRCNACGTVLSFWDLIPVLSWVLSRGACRYCGISVSFLYPLVEILCGVAALAAFISFGWSVELLFVVMALPFLCALFCIDLKYMLLPNQLTLIVFLIGSARLIYLSVTGMPVPDIMTTYFLGALLYAGLPMAAAVFVSWWRKVDSLGGGDVKFFFVAGIWLGIDILPYFMMLAGALAVMHGLTLRFLKKEGVFPFGPSLIASFYILLLFHGSFFM